MLKMPPLNLVRKWYRDPSHPSSFAGITKLAARHKLSSEKASKVLEGISSYSIHREVKKPRRRNPFFVYNRRDHVQADLVEVGQLAASNNGVRYLLTAIDMFSKWAVCVPMKNKKQETSIEALRELFRQMRPKTLMTDSGGEFIGRKVQDFLREEEVKHYTPGSDIKCAGVERFNKTLQRKMYHYMTNSGTDKYIDKLSDIVSSYNKSIHSVIEMSPQDAEKPENDLTVKDMLNRHYLTFFKKGRKKKPKFSLGDTVRVSKIKHPFMRSYKEQSNEELFEIVEIRSDLPIVMYKLKSLEDLEEIRGAFYESELTRIRLELFDVERVLKRRKRKGVKQVLVKWRGYHKAFNAWIPESDVTDL